MNTTATIVGNTTRDPDLRYATSGTAVLGLTVAVNERRRNAAGEWEDTDPTFVDVTLFGDTAENTAASCPKGTRVIVWGRLRQERWEKDGETRSKLAMVADEIGVTLRFAQAHVERAERRTPADAVKTVADAFGPGEEPF